MKKTPDSPLTFEPRSRQDWRLWLERHHATEAAVWLVYQKGSDRSLSYSDAVDEALCFGWIDSTTRSIDEHRYQQYFCRRKPGSTWSKVNKTKVARLLEEGLMAAAGLASIETAKANGSWSILDAVEELHIPHDLEKAWQLYPGARAYFTALSRTHQRNMLQWLVLAKRAETREKRIAEIVEQAKQEQRPVQFR